MPPLIDVKEVRLLHGPNRCAATSVLTFWIACSETLNVELIDRCGQALDGLLRENFTAQPTVEGEPVADPPPSEPARRLALLLGRLTQSWQGFANQPVSSFQLLPSPSASGVAGAAIGFRDVPVATGALTLSLRLVASWLAQVRGGPPGQAWLNQVKKNCEAFAQQARAQCLDLTTAALVQAAVARDIPWTMVVPTRRGVVLGQGRQQRRFIETVTDGTSSLADRLSRDKEATTQLLRRLGIPVPDSVLVPTAEIAVQEAARIGWPVVIKPNQLGKGVGVAVKLPDAQAVRTAFASAAKLGPVLVEQYLPGFDHRLLMLHGRLLAVARRVPACVTGDGRSTVQELIAQVNRDPRRGLGYDKPLVRIVLDDEGNRVLAAQGYFANAVPPAGQTVWLRGAANIATGGTSTDLTDLVHPDNRRLAERAIRAIGLDIAGLDFITPDISRSWREVGGAFIEVNASPGLRVHMGANPARDVAGAIVEAHFPSNRPARIPTVMVAGGAGKSAVCRLVAGILEKAERTVALTTSAGAFIGAELVFSGDQANGDTASRLLLDPAVDAGVFEMASASLRDGGMVLNGTTVGALLDVPDTSDGFGSREEQAALDGLIVRHARDWAVVNGDEPFCLKQLAGARARVACLVSREPNSEPVQTHLRQGGAVVALETADGQPAVVYRQQDTVQSIVALAELPGSPAHISAVLFAVAIALGLGCDAPALRAGLLDAVACPL